MTTQNPNAETEYQITGLIDEIDESGFSTEVTGSIYPYWTPTMTCSACKSFLDKASLFCKKHPNAPLIGNRFAGKLVDFDASNSNFIRYQFRAIAKMTCHRGPVDSPEPVIVNAGEMFTVSDLRALELDKMIGVVMLVTTKGKRKLPPMPDGTPRTLWEFDLKIDEASKKLRQAQLDALAQTANQVALENHRRKLEQIHNRRSSSLPSSPSPAALPSPTNVNVAYPGFEPDNQIDTGL